MNQGVRKRLLTPLFLTLPQMPGLEVVGLGLSRLLEFRSKLKEASSLLKDAETLISAMLIIDEFTALKDVEAIVERALERIREAKRIGRELMEEVDVALSDGGDEDEEDG